MGRLLITLVCCLSLFLHVKAQEPSKYKVGLFVPLYLDSAFDTNGQYLHGKSFPRQSISGLEFYEGAEYALQDLQLYRDRVEMHVFDIRSREGSVQAVSASPVMDSLDLMIGHVSGNEYLQLARQAKLRGIPFVSATYPNDGGVKESPQVIVLNPKLNTQLQVIYNTVLRNWGYQSITFIRRANKSDDRVEEVFQQLNKGAEGSQVMKYRRLIVPDNPMTKDIMPLLDSTRQNVLIVGSLDEFFALQILKASTTIPRSISCTLIGMPTWAGIRDLKKKEFNPLNLVYPVTYRMDSSARKLQFEEKFKTRTFSKPSDIAFRGYDATYYFVNLLLKYDTTLLSNLNDTSFMSQQPFQIKPIRWTKDAIRPDYHENKRVYMIRRQNGHESLVN